MTRKQHHYRDLLEVEGRGGALYKILSYIFCNNMFTQTNFISAVRGKTDYLEVAIKL